VELAGRDALACPDRNRFCGYASRAMRGIVIDYVRTRHARKRGGDLTFTTLDEAQHGQAPETENPEGVGAAPDQPADIQPALAQVVDLKFVAGFTFAEIAAAPRVT